MAAFTTDAAAEAWAKAKMVDKTWIVAHNGRLGISGAPCVRFQRPMSPTNPAYGAWVESTADNAT